MPNLPPHEKLLLETPLYALFDVDESDLDYMRVLRDVKFQFDAHCLECGERSTFRYLGLRGGGAGMPGRSPNWALDDGDFAVSVHCTRHRHQAQYLFSLKDGKLQKIGQLPSLQDVAGVEIEKYRKILGQQNFSELRKATGLASHGIGVGSFVYLRRIFESLVSQYHEERVRAGQVIVNFAGLRMDEKIRELSDVLPPALVKYRSTYSILSKGVHELDEDACRKHFAVVRAAIIQMLEQDFQAAERKKAEEELERAIADVHSDLKAEPSTTSVTAPSSSSG